MTDFFDIHPRLLELSRQAEQLCVPAFARIAEVEEYNGQKVLAAFRKAGISEHESVQLERFEVVRHY